MKIILESFPTFPATFPTTQSSQDVTRWEEINLQQQVRTLQQQMQSLLTPRSVIGSTSLANSSKSYTLSAISLLSSIRSLNKPHLPSWILNYGAIDHMTPILNEFVSYEPCYTYKNVQTIDDTLLRVVGIGSIRIAPIWFITHVLNVPKLFVSFLSIQKIAKMDEYKIIFDDVDAFLYNKVQA